MAFDWRNKCRGSRFTLKRLHANCGDPPPIWMHGRNRVYNQPALDEAQPSGGVSVFMRPVFRCFQLPPLVEDGNGSSSNDQSGNW